MKKILMNLFALCAISMSAHAVTCPEAATAQAADYYLSNPYYAVCTNLTATGNPNYPYKNAANENLKIADNDWIDYHWDGDCGVIYDNIYVSASANYNLIWTYRSGGAGSVKISVNGVDKGEFNTENTNWANKTLTVPDVALVAGQANTIKVWKKTNWPQNYSIQLSQQIQKSVVLLSHNDGTGMMDTVEAVNDAVMPAITAPVRENCYFVGYFDNAGTDEYNQYQYYAADASSYRKWDKTADTVTLYAHWTSNDEYLSVRYKARLANWKENKVAGWDNTLIDFNGGGSLYFENIYVSKKGIYTVNLERNSGNANCVMELYVNGTYNSDLALTDPTKWSSEFDVILLAGNNTIQVKQKTEWPVVKSLGLTLKQELTDQTIVTLKANDGTATSTEVTATKNEDMPAITAPERANYYFVGYFDNASTDVYEQMQYYAADASSFRVWDKDDATTNLYAHWTYTDEYLSVRYKARLANWKENKIPDWDKTLIDFNGGGSIYFENIYVSKKGIYTVNLERNSGSANCVIEVFVNGKQVQDVAIADPSKWNGDFDVKLYAGRNTIQIRQKTEWAVVKSLGLTLKQELTNYQEARKEQTLDAYGTICMQNNIIDMEGGSVWRIVGKTETSVEIERVYGELTAGNPYIFQADSDVVTVVYGTQSATQAGTDNGLIGTFTAIQKDGYYGIADNQLTLMAVGSTVQANRAYFDLTAITNITPSPVSQRRSMGIKGSATSLTENAATNSAVQKVLINGQLRLIKNNVKFNVLGQQL